MWRLLACLATLAAVLLLAAAPTFAQSALVTIVGVVASDSVCPPPQPSAQLPEFRAGQTVTVCFAGAVPGSGTTDIVVGQLHAALGQVRDSSLLMALPDQASPGTYTLGGTFNGVSISPTLIRFYPITRPRLTDLSPTIVTPGSEVRINGDGLSAPVGKITVSIGDQDVPATDVAPDGSWVVASVPAVVADATSNGGQKTVGVKVWQVPATQPPNGLTLGVREPVSGGLTLRVTVFALVPILLVVAAAALLYERLSRAQPGRRRNFVEGFLIESETQTYSLSRAQFYWWLLVISFAYSFLFIGHGLTAGNWSFPPLSGFAFTLLISTSTLLLATVTSNLRGQKGSGSVHPAWSDLIVNGGVVAPERVQQVLWTVLAGVALLWIVLNTYATATALPDVPTELLTLMGLSSAAYVGGKLVRNPGPNIKQVDRDPGLDPVDVLVSGGNLETDAIVLLDGAALPKSSISMEKPVPASGQYATQLRLKTGVSAAAWSASSHVLVIVNSDAQRSEFDIGLGPSTAMPKAPLDPAAASAVATPLAAP